MKKIVLIILDGLGDRPCKDLYGLTPLQFAYRPNMNFMASRGQSGLMYPVSPGVCTGSDTSHLSLLGYDPKIVYTGRGPFEAMGLGLLMNPGDIAFRANFGTIDEAGIVTDRRAGRISQGTGELSDSITMEIDGYRFTVKPGVEHRAALVVSGPALSDNVGDSDPHEVGLKVKKIEALSKEGQKTAELLNKYLGIVHEKLSQSKVNEDRASKGLPRANTLLLRGVGKAPELEPFNKKYDMKGSCIAGIPLIRGIGHLAGLETVNDPRMTGSYDSDYRVKVDRALTALKTSDFVMINFKATDVAGHDGKPLLKTSVIEKADKVLEPFLLLSDKLVIAITGDHSTPCDLKEHSGDPLPLLIYTSGIREGGSFSFDEVSCGNGSLKLGSDNLMQYLLAISGRAEKYGA